MHQTVPLRNSAVMLLESKSRTSHRLSRFEGPEDVDYRSLATSMKRCILARCCTAQSDHLRQGFLALAEFFHSREPFVFGLADQKGLTLLHLAVEAGNSIAVKYLVDDAKVSLTAKDNDGRPPLTTAIRRAADLTGKYSDGPPLLKEAVHHLVAWAARGGNNRSSPLPKSLLWQPTTAWLTAKTGKEEARKMRSVFEEIIKHLMRGDPKAGLRSDDKDNNGNSPWHYADGPGCEWIRRLRGNMIEGNSLTTKLVLERIRTPEPDSIQEMACERFDIGLMEIYMQASSERQYEVFKWDYANVYKAIYDREYGISRILDRVRGKHLDKDQALCRWVHVPANNASQRP